MNIVRNQAWWHFCIVPRPPELVPCPSKLPNWKSNHSSSLCFKFHHSRTYVFRVTKKGCGSTFALNNALLSWHGTLHTLRINYVSNCNLAVHKEVNGCAQSTAVLNLKCSQKRYLSGYLVVACTNIWPCKIQSKKAISHISCDNPYSLKHQHLWANEWAFSEKYCLLYSF